MEVESLRLSWKEQRILLAICNAISVIWLGSLCRACVGCRLRGPGVCRRLRSRTWEELSVIFTSEVSQCFFSSTSSSRHPRHLDAAASPSIQLGRGKGAGPPAPALLCTPASPAGVYIPPTQLKENSSGSKLTEPSVFQRLNYFLHRK